MKNLLTRSTSLCVHFHNSSSLVTAFKMPRYWLLKSEPDEYNINELEEQKTGRWDGIRNYQARNYIRDMNEDDIALFYHSSCPKPGVYGLMAISSAAYADPTAVDKKSKYYDKRITEGKNPWMSVDVKFVEKFDVPLLLPQIRELPLGACPLTARGNRLSVIPITDEQYELFVREARKLNEVD